MNMNRRYLLGLSVLAAAGLCLQTATVHAADWRAEYPEVTLGVITSENEADRVARYKPVRAYLESALGVGIKWRTATDYAGVIEGVKAGKIELARFGPASYAKAWMVMQGAVAPLVGELDRNGDFGYYSVLAVKADSPYQGIEDLRGKKLAFADPNSTSGYQAPRYFMTEAGIEVDSFFGSTAFSGSHENSVIALLNGTFDVAATWWRSEARSNPQRMADKGMIPGASWRVVWKSPRLPSSPWAMATGLPEQMRADITDALMNMKDADPQAWEALTDGKASGFRRVTHADYEAVVRMIKANQRKRRHGS